MLAISIDGVLVAPADATISVLDRGLLYGDGLFEILRTWNGVAVELDAHLARLRASAQALQLHVPAELAAYVTRTIAAARVADHRVRIILTRGPGALGARLGSLTAGRAIVIVSPLPPQATELSLAIVDYPLPRRAGVGYKTLAFLDHVVARELAAAAGADEAIRLGPEGDVVECATSNVFAVLAGRVVTPRVDAGALPGIMRARVLATCAELGIAASEQRLTLDELRSADEIFVTSSLRGVVAVTFLDGTRRSGGPITATLRENVVRWLATRAALL